MAKSPRRSRRANNADGNHVARNTYTNFDGEPNPEITDRICELLEKGELLKNICEMEMMPSWRQVWRWMDRDPDGFGASLERAKRLGAEWRDEEIQEIADADDVVDMVDVARNKLRIEVRERRNARINPARFAERRALPPAITPPGQQGESAEQEDAAAIASLNTIANRLASYAKTQRGAPRLINVTPVKKEAKK